MTSRCTAETSHLNDLVLIRVSDTGHIQWCACLWEDSAARGLGFTHEDERDTLHDTMTRWQPGHWPAVKPWLRCTAKSTPRPSLQAQIHSAIEPM